MRYFASLSYLGTAYHGWQRQPNATSVQQVLEEAFALVLRQPIGIIGCGRTDTGVHARNYVLHFDWEEELPESLVLRLNKILPKDIAIHHLAPVAPEAHARFDAYFRAYEYHFRFAKDPFSTHTAYRYPFATQLNREKLQAAASLLLQFDDFFPFCKTNSDAKTTKCTLHRAEWVFGKDNMVFHIAANRFLRGMVRLIVGMSLNVALGKFSLETVEKALREQSLLPKSYSVPAEGLFLTDIRYPYTWETGAQ